MDKMSIREQTQLIEEQTLSNYATLAKNTRGRINPSKYCDIRTEFQKDRDKILHCSSFRRLKNKTQVFLSPQGEHYRTRLTHTLEVSQIARTIARALRLNEDLTEAISLGHDLGHTPFGHAGEKVLNQLRKGGFRHNIQSVRVVDHLENYGNGLNLTYEVKNGIACHSDHMVQAKTLEGKIVRISDKIAYVNHDIEDAIRAKVLDANDLPYDSIYILGRTKSERITTCILSLLKNSVDDIVMDSEVLKAHQNLKTFMFENVYTNPAAKSEEAKAQGIVENLYYYFLKNSQELPEFYNKLIEKFGVERVVCDYIAGMSDHFAVDLYKEIHIPHFWENIKN